MSSLRELLSIESPDLAAVASHLDALESSERVAEIRTLNRAHQARLFEAAKGWRPITLDDLVPIRRGAMQEVVHEGKNSLPLFNRFAKAFVRPAPGDATELWGYNRAGCFVETVVGPGYFVACNFEREGEVLVDYLRVPPNRPEHWPPIVANSARLSRFVYHRTQDILRGVSAHVSIGRATKAGRRMSAWFVLCRQDPSQ
jgi:hypothetical protein